MSSIFKMPHDILIHIYEYNPEHREKMKWVLNDIRYIQYCYVCNKIIIRYVYSIRNCDINCCSMLCLDTL
jgi:hypothetical protein